MRRGTDRLFESYYEGLVRFRNRPRPSNPPPSRKQDMGSGTPVCWKVLMTCEILAVPLVPEVTLMSLETETVFVAAKNTMSLKFLGGLVTLICAVACGQLNNVPPTQYCSVTPLSPVPVKEPLKNSVNSFSVFA